MDLNRGRSFLRELADMHCFIVEPSVQQGVETIVKVSVKCGMLSIGCLNCDSVICDCVTCDCVICASVICDCHFTYL